MGFALGMHRHDLHPVCDLECQGVQKLLMSQEGLQNIFYEVSGLDAVVFLMEYRFNLECLS